MNRRWQKDGVGRYESLPSMGWMLAQLPPLTNDARIADIADVYSTFSTLHAKSRNPQPLANQQLSFYYFTADAPVSAQQHLDAAATAATGGEEAGAEGGGVQGQGAAPPSSGRVRIEHVVPISSKFGGLTMECLRSLFFLGPNPDTGAQLKPAAQQDAQLPCSQQQPQEQGQGQQGQQGQGQQGQGHEGQGQHEGQVQRQQQGHSHLSQPAQQGPPASHIMLAIADDDGSVSLMRLFSHVQPPFEGPEVLPDAMEGHVGGGGGGPGGDGGVGGGGGGESDSD